MVANQRFKVKYFSMVANLKFKENLSTKTPNQMALAFNKIHQTRKSISDKTYENFS